MYYIIANTTRNTVPYPHSQFISNRYIDSKSSQIWERFMPEILIEIQNYPIKLGQFLKLANIVQDGLEAKFIILNGEIRVNNRVEKRRGRKLIKKDRIEIDKHVYICI